MSNRTRDDAVIETDAAALLKAVAVTTRDADIYAAFQRIDAPDLVKGHAWRAIRRATGNAMLTKWQRSATPEQAQRMLQSAARFAAEPRRNDPAERSQFCSNTSRHRLGDLRRLVDGYVDARLAGKTHDELGKYALPVHAARAPKAPPSKPFDIRDRVRALRLEAVSVREISRQTGLSRSTVHRVIRVA